MRTSFLAVWYDPQKVEARAIARGWPKDGDGMLDYYSPEEDPRGAEVLECRDLKSAETHLRNIIADGKDFYGVTEIQEIEVDGPRCQYCICRGRKLVRRYQVEESGVIESVPCDDCASDED